MKLDVLSYFKNLEFKKYFPSYKKCGRKTKEKWVIHDKNRIRYSDNELYPLDEFPSFVVYRIKD